MSGDRLQTLTMIVVAIGLFQQLALVLLLVRNFQLQREQEWWWKSIQESEMRRKIIEKLKQRRARARRVPRDNNP